LIDFTNLLFAQTSRSLLRWQMDGCHSMARALLLQHLINIMVKVELFIMCYNFR